MAKPLSTHWGTADPTYQIEPSAGKKALGWQKGEKPAFQYFNWIIDRGADWEDWSVAKTENIEPVIIRSDDPIAWDSGTGELSFTAALQIVFRNGEGDAQINQFNAGSSPLTLADGEVVVVKRDRDGVSPVNLGAGSYGSLADGEFDIIPESSMTAADEENEMVFVRRRGDYLEFPYLGIIVDTGTTFEIGLQSGGAIGPHTHDAADIISGVLNIARIPNLPASQITSGTFADALIAQSNVTQHQAALALAASQIVSGTFADARVAQSNVTQHQAALSILETQIPDGALLARVADPENITGDWKFPSADPPDQNQMTRQGPAKAYAQIQGSGALTGTGYNIASTAKFGTGQYSISWDRDFLNTEYSVKVSNFRSHGVSPSSSSVVTWNSLAAGSMVAEIVNFNPSAGTLGYLDGVFSVTAHGDH